MCLDQSKAHLPAAQERSSLQLQSALAHLSTGWAECQSAAGRRSKRGQDAQGAQGLKISTPYRRPSSAGDPDVPPTAPCRQPARLWGVQLAALAALPRPGQPPRPPARDRNLWPQRHRGFSRLLDGREAARSLWCPPQPPKVQELKPADLHSGRPCSATLARSAQLAVAADGASPMQTYTWLHVSAAHDKAVNSAPLEGRAGQRPAW